MPMLQNTGWREPGTMVGNRTVTGSEVDWSNPDNAKGQGVGKATAVAGGGEDTSGLAASNFDFSMIPAGSIITGIEVRVGAYTFGSAAGLFNVARLILPDNSDGLLDKSGDLAAPTSVEKNDEAGGPEDLWAESNVDMAFVQDVDFGFFVSMLAAGSGGTFAIDFMQMRITYRLSTGWVFPGTTGNISRTGADATWVNPDNVKADDAVSATCDLNGTGDDVTWGLRVTNFDFSSIPAGVTIDGVEIKVGDYNVDSTAASPVTGEAVLIDGDTGAVWVGGDDKAADIPNPPNDPSLQFGTAGGAADLWGLPINRAEVLKTDFGFSIGFDQTPSVSATQFRIDYCQMRIHYHIGLPQTLLVEGAVPGHNPPHHSSSGAGYAVVFNNDFGASEQLNVIKATDPVLGPWAEVDAAGAPLTTGGVVSSVLSSVKDGEIIHIAWKDSNVYRYSNFDMATDEWASFTSQTIQSIGADPSDQHWISIAVRGGGELVVNYSGLTDGVKGGEKERVDANVRSGSPPTWGGPIALDAGGDFHYGNPVTILGTNDFVHVLWQQTANTADPPTAWERLEGRSIDPADDSLSTMDFNNQDTGGALLGMQNAVTYNDPITSPDTQRVVFIGARPDTLLARVSADCREVSNVLEVNAEDDPTDPDTGMNGETAVITVANLNDDLHVLYADLTDFDLYYTTSTDNGSTWVSPTEEIDGITVNHISASIIVRGLDTLMAYVYDDGGVQKYNEKLLFSGPRRPMFLERPKIGARYY